MPRSRHPWQCPQEDGAVPCTCDEIRELQNDLQTNLGTMSNQERTKKCHRLGELQSNRRERWFTVWCDRFSKGNGNGSECDDDDEDDDDDDDTTGGDGTSTTLTSDNDDDSSSDDGGDDATHHHRHRRRG